MIETGSQAGNLGAFCDPTCCGGVIHGGLAVGASLGYDVIPEADSMLTLMKEGQPALPLCWVAWTPLQPCIPLSE